MEALDTESGRPASGPVASGTAAGRSPEAGLAGPVASGTAAAFAPPGAEDDPREPGAVEDVVHARDVQVVEGVLALLALADLPLVDGRGHLQHPVAVRDDADQQLGSLVLRLLEADGPRHLGAHGPQAEGGVADPLPGEQADQEGEEPYARPADRVLGFLAAHPARPGDEIGLALDDRGEQGLDLHRVVLAVGVRGDDVLRAALARNPVAEPERGTLPAVDRDVADDGASRVGLLGGGVGAAVGDHDHLRGHPAHRAGQRLDDRADRAFLVVGGDHQRDGGKLGGALAVAVGKRPQGVSVDRRVRRVGVKHAHASVERPGPGTGQAAAGSVPRWYRSLAMHAPFAPADCRPRECLIARPETTRPCLQFAEDPMRLSRCALRPGAAPTGRVRAPASVSASCRLVMALPATISGVVTRTPSLRRSPSPRAPLRMLLPESNGLCCGPAHRHAGGAVVVLADPGCFSRQTWRAAQRAWTRALPPAIRHGLSRTASCGPGST